MVRGGGPSPAWLAALPTFLGAADSSGLPDGLTRTTVSSPSTPIPHQAQPGASWFLRLGFREVPLEVREWETGHPSPHRGITGDPADTAPTAWGRWVTVSEDPPVAVGRGRAAGSPGRE